MTKLILPPGPPAHWLVGHAFRLWQSPLAMLTEGMLRYGPITHYRFGADHYFQLNDPDAIQEVLVKNHHKYKKSRNYKALKATLGQGLLTSEGAVWKRQRKLMQPAFVPHRLETFLDAMVRHTDIMLAQWAAGLPDRNVHEEMMRLTLRVVGETLFSADLDGDAKEVSGALATVVGYAGDQAQSFFRPPLWLPTPTHFRFKRARKKLDALVYRIISARRQSGQGQSDLLGLLMAATDESGQGHMNDEQLHDEVMTLVLAGHETTANALTWTWFLLSQHPDVERRLALEAQHVLGDRMPTVADLSRLAFTERVVQESMRLCPPAWIFEREALEDDEVAGYRIPKGSSVMISPYSVHRDPKYWDNPEGFDPDRFLPERSVDRPRYAYIPFGAGPRVCIGNGFAMMEAKIMVAMIARRYRLELVPGHGVTPDPGVTLRPLAGVPMTLHPQDTAATVNAQRPAANEHVAGRSQVSAPALRE